MLPRISQAISRGEGKDLLLDSAAFSRKTLGEPCETIRNVRSTPSCFMRMCIYIYIYICVHVYCILMYIVYIYIHILYNVYIYIIQ